MPTHETAIITGNVTISESAIIEPYAIITGPGWIGDDAYIGAHAVIGAPSQHHGSYPAPVSGSYAPCGFAVEQGACVREYATIHQGIVQRTRIGAESLVMAYSHIAHDCVLGERVTLATSTILGGFTRIDDDVTFGQAVVTHPWVLVGESAMVGLNSSVVKDVLPYSKVAGAPARLLGTNTHRDPGLPREYDETILSGDVWERWNDLVDERHKLRDLWGQRAA